MKPKKNFVYYVPSPPSWYAGGEIFICEGSQADDNSSQELYCFLTERDNESFFGPEKASYIEWHAELPPIEWINLGEL